MADQLRPEARWADFPRGRTPAVEQTRMKMMTVPQIASEMRVSRMTVYRLIQGGELPAHRFGRTLRVTEQDFFRYLRGSVEVDLT